MGRESGKAGSRLIKGSILDGTCVAAKAIGRADWKGNGNEDDPKSDSGCETGEEPVWYLFKPEVTGFMGGDEVAGWVECALSAP